jgi:hypothetical protein
MLLPCMIDHLALTAMLSYMLCVQYCIDHRFVECCVVLIYIHMDSRTAQLSVLTCHAAC